MDDPTTDTGAAIKAGDGSEDPYTIPTTTLHRTASSRAACATVRASCRFDPSTYLVDRRIEGLHPGLKSDIERFVSTQGSPVFETPQSSSSEDSPWPSINQQLKVEQINSSSSTTYAISIKNGEVTDEKIKEISASV
ncbi:hypothetical protein RB195_000999 [Necator americanus]|uniref:Uncharacterized protein n=1 Tax=Necator americanus TaxID=51031 RepID=A0ABR1DDK5_NECAM